MKPDTTSSLKGWPYPLWIAHRGAGKLAPENTLAAFRLGASHGYRMFECDAKLSSDGVVFLLHDDTLERTSSGQGVAGKRPWSDLSQVDAGSWHSRQYAGEPLPTLAHIARFCQANAAWLNIEIKPTVGLERETGQRVAEAAQQLWAHQPAQWAPLLTSFQPEALIGAREAAPDLRRGLLLDSLWAGWQSVASDQGCVALVCHHTLWTPALREETRQLGLRAMAYTVNEIPDVKRLIELQLDGIITDRVERFAPER
ncbi:glycerophosphodiester phosphodiesterase [Hydrogenophaga sp. PAMC20947]|uniref:glycerophosphodiester phosphodiesterase n=1 Tax=Hydrogenophaga sp. PAMC20947 TaxID=2565558 RepID=UPI00109D8375|nr:glycerophosphodiester phosphodiesterase [Hydrogenophaga sp. PAMC20947]QCB46678.1 glycerophosphodiester phosphodiesterase [Hydrogenophaga sp. PAMC20947]